MESIYVSNCNAIMKKAYAFSIYFTAYSQNTEISAILRV